MPRTEPHLRFESAVLEANPAVRRIAGVDEAGRGALAGPVVAAAVILPLHDPSAIAELKPVNDSKLLSPKKREQYFELVEAHAAAVGVGIVSASEIDQIGIVPATHRAMVAAVAQLTPPADFLLVDGRIHLSEISLPQEAIIRGDSQSVTIAAASIIAKVTRDRIMVELDPRHPCYRFAQHKGYGTQFHRDAIAKHGPCPHHRHTFAPIRHPVDPVSPPDLP